jgi:hypothetical protein
MTKLLKNFKHIIVGLSEGLQAFRTYKRGKVK